MILEVITFIAFLFIVSVAIVVPIILIIWWLKIRKIKKLIPIKLIEEVKNEKRAGGFYNSQWVGARGGTEKRTADRTNREFAESRSIPLPSAGKSWQDFSGTPAIKPDRKRNWASFE